MAAHTPIPEEVIKQDTETLGSAFMELGEIHKECKTIESEVNKFSMHQIPKVAVNLKIQ